jgi:hypothetical protein
MTEISGTLGSIARVLPRTRKLAMSKAGTNAETAWRRWATQHRVVAAMLGGLVGVHFASVLGSWFGGFHLYRLDYSTGNGAVYLPKAAPAVQFVVGGLSHYADGVFFALIFAVAVSPVLPLPATRVGNVAKAMIFGTILAALALFVTAPYAFAPLRGIHDPLIAIHLGWKYVISVLIFHWIYGLQLGLIYSPLDKDLPAA